MRLQASTVRTQVRRRSLPLCPDPGIAQAPRVDLGSARATRTPTIGGEIRRSVAASFKRVSSEAAIDIAGSEGKEGIPEELPDGAPRRSPTDKLCRLSINRERPGPSLLITTALLWRPSNRGRLGRVN
ncbi:hypothetical protein KM043_010279 [Ampulex compressa]|nr:hypothetical protein KM043_010279 [Ampulex compressa]